MYLLRVFPFFFSVLSFKASADILRTQLNDLSQIIHKTIQPVFVSQRINQHLKLCEAKPPLVSQQSLVYQFKGDLCDAGYVGFTRRHLHQRVDEHRHTSSSIGKHFHDKHSSTPKDLTTNFSILKKCNSKFDCFYEMFFIIFYYFSILFIIFPYSKNATESLTASMRCFLLSN